MSITLIHKQEVMTLKSCGIVAKVVYYLCRPEGRAPRIDNTSTKWAIVTCKNCLRLR